MSVIETFGDTREARVSGSGVRNDNDIALHEGITLKQTAKNSLTGYSREPSEKCFAPTGWGDAVFFHPIPPHRGADNGRCLSLHPGRLRASCAAASPQETFPPFPLWRGGAQRDGVVPVRSPHMESILKIHCNFFPPATITL